MLYFAPLWIFSGLLLLYDLYIATQHIHSVFCLQRLFLFLVSFSPSHFGVSSAFLSHISICCGFTPLLLLPCFVSAFLYMAALSPLFFRSFGVETSLQCRQLLLRSPIIYRFIDNYLHLEILRCLCVVTSWLPSIRLPASACIGLLCARKSMSVDSKHQYIVFLQQFLKGGFYTVKN